MHNLAKREFVEDKKKALAYSEESIALSRTIQDKNWLMESLRLSGAIALNSGFYGLAATYNTEFLAVARSLNDTYAKGIAYFNLGGIRIIIEDYEKAIEYTEKGFELLLENEAKTGKPVDQVMLLNLKNNLGLVYLQIEDYPRAEKNLKEARELALQIGKEADYSRATLNLGRLYNQTKVLDKAYDLFVEAAAKTKKNNDFHLHGTSLFFLAEINFQKGDFEQADSLFLRSYQIGEQLNEIGLRKKSAEALANVRDTLGKSEEGLKYLQIAHDLEKQMKIGAAKESMARQELLDSFAEKEKEFEVVFQTKENYFVYIRSFIVLSLVILVLFVFLYRKFKKETLKSMSLTLTAEKLELEKKLLKAEVEQKDKQLASKLMYDMQVNDLIGRVVNQLAEVKGKARKDVQKSLDGSISKLEAVKEENVWEEFERRFVDVHKGFFDELMRVNPGLSRNERRLCAFLRLDMSTKEIAALTGQTPKTIDVARYRLRKKLDLINSGQNLSDFLASLG